MTVLTILAIATIVLILLTIYMVTKVSMSVTPSKWVELEFPTPKADAPMIKTNILGKDYYMLVDTGASVNVIDKSFAKRMMFADSSKHDSVTGINGNYSESAPRKLVPFKFGTYEYVDEFTQCDFSTAREINVDNVEIVGILSNEFILRHKWVIDTNNMVMLIR